MSSTYISGQALSLNPVASGSLDVDTPFLVSANDPRTVRIQAVYWTGTGNLIIKDSYGIEIYSGDPSTLTYVNANLPYITVTTPLLYTLTGAAANGGKKVYVFGEFV